MAIVKNNVVTEGLSGKLSNIVFRNVGGKTVVAVKPDTSKRKDSEAQKKHKRRFRAATIYAKNATQDPILKEEYAAKAKPGQTAYNVALADFLNIPEISELDLKLFNGVKGSKILVQVVDDHLVTEVQISIYDAQGALVEEGQANEASNGLDWIYTTQKAMANPSGGSVFIRASDMAGNTTEHEEVIA